MYSGEELQRRRPLRYLKKRLNPRNRDKPRKYWRKPVADGVADRNPLRNGTRIRRKICRLRTNAEGSSAREHRCLSVPVVSVSKELLLQAGGPWGHSLYVPSVTCRMLKFKMLLPECCQSDLLRPQSQHRFCVRGPARRNDRGHECRCRQHRRCKRQHHRIARRHSK
jgi:hypothetical protein